MPSICLKACRPSSLIVWDLNSPYAKFTSLGIPDTSGVDTPYPHSPISNHSSSTRVHFQAAAAETITALSFCPSSEYLILAGVAGRFLRLYDTRLGSVATTATPVNIPCKVQALTMDPLDNSRFACWGDGVITLWDRRHMSVPTLTFSTADAVADGARAGAELAMVEFSSERRGLLATLERDAAHLRFWDVLQAPAERKETKDGVHVLKASREGVQPRVPKLSWTNPAAAIMSSWTGSGSSQVELTPVPEHSAAERSVLANTWKSTFHDAR
jgi:WD40 repeat protein